MAKAQEQRIAYLTYPVRAGITVTFSRGFSPHSAAGFCVCFAFTPPPVSYETGTLSCYELVETQCSTAACQLQGKSASYWVTGASGQ